MILNGCPICAYKEYKISNESDIGSLCSSCGYAYKYDYDNSSGNELIQRLRNKWVSNSGGAWYGNDEREPLDWSSHREMREAGMEYPLIPTLMAFYNKGFIDGNFTEQWADEYLDTKHDDFEHLMMLSLKGAEYCSKRSSADFPLTRKFNFIEEFALKTHHLNLGDPNLVDQFIHWFTYDYHYGLDDPTIDGLIGEIDMIVDDTGIVDAREYFTKNIKKFKEYTRELNDVLWDEIK